MDASASRPRRRGMLFLGLVLAGGVAAVPDAPRGKESKPPEKAAAPAEPPKKDIEAIRKEIETAEKAAFARIDALATQAGAAAVARRVRPALASARRKAWLALFKDENPWRYYATKDYPFDGYGPAEADAVEAATEEVCAIFFAAPDRDVESGKTAAETRKALEALAVRRQEEGLPPCPRSAEDALQAACERIAEALTPFSDLAILRQNDAAAKALDEFERLAQRDMNLYRLALGFPALRLDARLCRAAKGHSEEMARLGYMAHESPTPGRQQPQDRARLAGYVSGGIGENIAQLGSKEDGSAPVAAWRDSPPHHKNMLATYTNFGVGEAPRETKPPAEKAPPEAGKAPPPAASGGPDATAGEEPPPPKKKKKGGKGKANAVKGPRPSRYWTAVFGGSVAIEARKRMGIR